eukprot:9308824-Pyramimonas_sp.AAC.1
MIRYSFLRVFIIDRTVVGLWQHPSKGRWVRELNPGGRLTLLDRLPNVSLLPSYLMFIRPLMLRREHCGRNANLHICEIALQLCNRSVALP